MERTREIVFKEFEKIHLEMNKMEREGLAPTKEYWELGQRYKALEKELRKL